MKTTKQRGGASAAVLDAPLPGYVSSPEPAWRGQGPAPAGALQRGYAADPPGTSGYNPEPEEEYRPRRGAFRPGMRGLLRSTGGRIVLGLVAFLLLGGLLVGLAAARSYLLHDPRFVVADSDDIQIIGNMHLTREQLLAVFGGDLERNIFRVSLADREADLERLPWVQHATVMRLLPNELRVQIVERTPVAFARHGTQIGLVDANGLLLDMGPNIAADMHYSFPVLTGLSANEPLPARAAQMAIYLHFIKELDGGGQHFSKTVSEVDVTDLDDLKAMIASGNPEILVHFGDEKFLSRYDQFEKLLPEWRQQYPKLASADMRYQGQIVLEMRKDRGEIVEEGGGSAAQAPPLHPPTIQPRIHATPAVAGVAMKKPVMKAVEEKPAAEHTMHASGTSAANEKFYAALAAQRKAAEATR